MKKRFTAWRKPLGLTAAAVLGAGSLALATAPAANAAVNNWPSIATVGVPVQLTAQNICPSNELTIQVTYANGAQYSSPSVLADINGSATIYWAPPVAGTITQAIVASTCTPVSLTGVQVNAVGTSTTVAAPNNAKVGTATKITVTVQSNSPSAYNPTGQVVVKDINGATLQTMGLTAGPGNGQAYAYWWWTPQSAGSYTFQATYSGDGNALQSTSPQDVTVATPSGNAITLTHPSAMTQGVPVTLTATVAPNSIQGSVGFTVNGNPISPSIPLVNGVANFTWTPNLAGTVTIGASYTTNQGGSGSTSDQVTISGAPAQQDAITLVQPGWGPWAPNGTYTLGNGSNFTFQASSLSGAAVTLSETGPCQVNGLTITVPVGSGACNLKASTNGGNGYAPVTYGYTVNLIPGVQTATLSAPVSGRYKVGRVLVLESPSQQDTNAGQNISWKVKKGGKAVCKLLYPNDGSVTLRIAKKGSCTVIGSAPGVPGQWQPFQTARNYTGR